MSEIVSKPKNKSIEPIVSCKYPLGKPYGKPYDTWRIIPHIVTSWKLGLVPYICGITPDIRDTQNGLPNRDFHGM